MLIADLTRSPAHPDAAGNALRRQAEVIRVTLLALGLALLGTSCLTPPGAQPPASEKSAAANPAPAGASVAPPAPRPKLVSVPGLPTRFAWASSGPLILPKSDAGHDLVALKDPTVVRYGDRWNVYATSVGRGGIYGMVYLSFADWSEAPAASIYYMDQTPGFKTYVAAPQLFYFTPQKKWYLIFQSGPPMYATADDPGDPTKWTEPAPMFAKTPAIVEKNGGWLDFWVICDSQLCHLFFSNDHGRWYQSKTPIAKFPHGFSDPVVVLQDAEAGRVFEACNVYKIDGTNKYLALIEAFDETSSWRRYFRSWTADSLEGPWTSLHDDAASPFAGEQNVTFDGPPWSHDISHGEMIRAGYDETMAVDGKNLQYLYQGFDPSASTSDYNAIPWRLGLLTMR
jgi:endo-1,4-beta-xylanase